MTAADIGRKEWLEPDGLGGFASGTVSGARTRRYHALLLTATEPPTGRIVLVNGLDALVETPAGAWPISTQVYQPGVRHPQGEAHLQRFEGEPWPTWTFQLPDGTAVRQELFARHGTTIVAMSWRLLAPGRARLSLRPYLSGRDYHALHHENPAFRFAPEAEGPLLRFRPYGGVPAIGLASNGEYRHEPDWYRRFLYEEERARGLDHEEDLASPGTLRFDLAEEEAVLLLAPLQEQTGPLDGVAPRAWLERARTAERSRRAAFPSALHRAGDAYLVRRGSGMTIVAGYPWFTDWGRDTFISVRGLCLATGRLSEAASILTEWAGLVSEGMLPNRFPDQGGTPEYNSVDASLWFVIAVYELFRAAGSKLPLHRAQREALTDAVAAILEGFEARFWNERLGWLNDVVDVDRRRGEDDETLRPNQVLAVGGLPWPVLGGDRARRMVEVVGARLWTPLGLRSLDPAAPRYKGHYPGSPRDRDLAYHQGTVWPWLSGPFAEAWLRVRGDTEEARHEGRKLFVEPLLDRLGDAGLGHLPEVADAEPPHAPGGCPFQAWSVAELLRLLLVVLETGGAKAGRRVLLAAAFALGTFGVTPPVRAFEPDLSPTVARAFPIDVHSFKVLERDSGPQNYYRTLDEPLQSFIRGVYRPGLDTVTLFTEVPDELRRGARRVRWRWRALVLPREGNECVDDRGDAAANVYVTWKRGMKWYSLKFVWSTEAPVGATCNGKRNAFVAQDSIILRSGPPVGVWQDEEVDLDRLFRQHFEGGDPAAEIPELQGLGILSDGDQTHSASGADFAGFVFYK